MNLEKLEKIQENRVFLLLNYVITFLCIYFLLVKIREYEVNLNFEVKNEKISKAFWSTSSFMAPYYNLLFTISDWLTSKGVKREEAEKYTRELFLALSEDSMIKNKLTLRKLLSESQTPGGTNAFVLQQLKKNKFYKIQQKVLNSIFKKF